ncbi:aspartate carbamoyltransferase catalytic subunit [Wenzhouxiangella sp. XN24]|uniref:aspartate carbamoyltransferase catalytic subunit n=1 Tax=Wenzhouxiangella sp. XN24 TaxID=2713569 RepID=UPI0013ECAA44|nr:aspartate carbamoyltransferase catalytic subunit [Wenzhouxiangella sp. XN24]NGX16069.1 aspartate carbamoyltransferase catalytic subunit [Wenzhouxiangella sp. XN24]
MASQFDARGRLRHLVTLKDLSRAQLVELLDLADRFITPYGEFPARDPALAGRTVANLFFEPSTRTRASFELAARRLGADVLSLDVSTSSRAKGESLLDTIYTLQAMQVDVFVIRDAQSGVPAFICDHVAPHVAVLNAGESHLNHPTQGLLDVLTMRRHKGGFENLVVTIAGDIQHSRVARSAHHALKTLGIGELRLVAPAALAPDPDEFAGATLLDNIEAGVRDADVVMCLRIQRERMEVSRNPDPADFHREFGLTPERLALARPDAIVMHPGPMNRDVEIAGSVADSRQSVITEQVRNGVAVRMAVMQTVMETLHG